MKESKRYFFFFALFFCILRPIFSQNCVIEGILPGAEGREMELITVRNHLSQNQEVIQRRIIAPDGSFSFVFPVSEIMLVTLSVNFYTTTFFVAPGKQYNLKGKEFRFDNFVNPFISKPLLPLYMVDTDTLNRFLIRFNYNMNRVEETNYYAVLSRQDFTPFDKLYMPTDELPEEYQRFCGDYQYYHIGALKATYSKNRSQQLGVTYLGSAPPDAHNYNYMIFFNAYFSNYLPDHGNNISIASLRDAINRQQDLQKALEILKGDPILNNEILREMYFVKFIKDNSLDIKASVKVLSELKLKTRHPFVKEAADHIIKEAMHLAPTTNAPSFSLPNVENDTIRSENLKGKYVYVNFFKTNCLDCLAEMEQMRSLYEKNKLFFEFVSICIDDQYHTFTAFSRNYTYPWHVVYAGYHQDFILQWKAKTMPYYLLIDNEYKIITASALSTEDGIGYTMEKISWEERRKQRAKETGQ